MFDQRFAGVIEQLQVDHVGRVRNVSFAATMKRNLRHFYGSEKCGRFLFAAVQVVERQVRHHPDADRQRRFVGEEQRRVIHAPPSWSPDPSA